VDDFGAVHVHGTYPAVVAYGYQLGSVRPGNGSDIRSFVTEASKVFRFAGVIERGGVGRPRAKSCGLAAGSFGRSARDDEVWPRDGKKTLVVSISALS